MSFHVLTSFWFTRLIAIFRRNNNPAQTAGEIITGSGNRRNRFRANITKLICEKRPELLPSYCSPILTVCTPTSRHFILCPFTACYKSCFRSKYYFRDTSGIIRWLGHFVPSILNSYFRCAGADKSLARPTSRCILFDGENISFDASLVTYI